MEEKKGGADIYVLVGVKMIKTMGGLGTKHNKVQPLYRKETYLAPKQVVVYKGKRGPPVLV